MSDQPTPVNVLSAVAFQDLYRPYRYKVFYGGRGGAKSWEIAQALIVLAYSKRLRILCAREFQISMADSVHKLLTDTIERLGLLPFFNITRTSITSLTTGSEFLFKGLRTNILEIKSTEGIDICWVEEAQSVSKESWEILIPTIRKDGSEIWVSFNPGEESDPTYQRFVKHPPPGSVVRKVGWQDNPWFPKTLDEERLYLKSIDAEAYDHVWEGNPRKLSDAVIFKGRYVIEPFLRPEGVILRYGVDWGFANDPLAIVQSFVVDDCLYIENEKFGHNVELDTMEAFFDAVPGTREWPLKADCSRPETISFMASKGFGVTAAEKWPGSVEDGIAHLKGFRKIYIHPRCKNMAFEARSYSWKVDPKTGDVLPLIVDKHNHGWDAVRYSMDGYIQRRGAAGQWERLAG